MFVFPSTDTVGNEYESIGERHPLMVGEYISNEANAEERCVGRTLFLFNAHWIIKGIDKVNHVITLEFTAKHSSRYGLLKLKDDFGFVVDEDVAKKYGFDYLASK